MPRRNFVIFTLFLSLILWSGAAAWLGFHHLALWPWSHQWHMFSYSSDSIYKLRAVGYINDQISQNISLEPYFSYPANRYTNRADEMSRRHENLLKLTAFLCTDNPHLTHIQLNQEVYRKLPGDIPDLKQSSDVVQVLLPPTPCPS